MLIHPSGCSYLLIKSLGWSLQNGQCDIIIAPSSYSDMTAHNSISNRNHSESTTPKGQAHATLAIAAAHTYTPRGNDTSATCKGQRRERQKTAGITDSDP